MKLNDDKTEILHFTNKFRMCPQIDSVFLGSSTIATVETARNLGVTMDRFLTMSKHVSNICKAASFALHKIGTLRQFLSQAATEKLVHALIMPVSIFATVYYMVCLIRKFPGYKGFKIQRLG